jgi:hypothetical protein
MTSGEQKQFQSASEAQASYMYFFLYSRHSKVRVE